ncbi:hypothetical protein RFI_35740, partial [Reticulomyxa filosa]
LTYPNQKLRIFTAEMSSFRCPYCEYTQEAFDKIANHMWKFKESNSVKKHCRGKSCNVINIEPKMLTGKVLAQLRIDFTNWNWDIIKDNIKSKKWSELQKMRIDVIHGPQRIKKPGEKINIREIFKSEDEQNDEEDIATIKSQSDNYSMVDEKSHTYETPASNIANNKRKRPLSQITPKTVNNDDEDEDANNYNRQPEIDKFMLRSNKRIKTKTGTSPNNIPEQQLAQKDISSQEEKPVSPEKPLSPKNLGNQFEKLSQADTIDNCYKQRIMDLNAELKKQEMIVQSLKKEKEELMQRLKDIEKDICNLREQHERLAPQEKLNTQMTKKLILFGKGLWKYRNAADIYNMLQCGEIATEQIHEVQIIGQASPGQKIFFVLDCADIFIAQVVKKQLMKWIPSMRPRDIKLLDITTRRCQGEEMKIVIKDSNVKNSMMIVHITMHIVADGRILRQHVFHQGNTIEEISGMNGHTLGDIKKILGTTDNHFKEWNGYPDTIIVQLVHKIVPITSSKITLIVPNNLKKAQHNSQG